MTDVKIAPSLLSADFSELGKEVRRAEAGGADLIHWDIMDGHFVPNITFGPAAVQALRGKTRLPFDVHLMIENPEDHIERFAKAGGDIITVHAEACADLKGTIAKVKKQGVKVGVALNPETPLDVLERILGGLDVILVMSVHPGFGGQKFIPATLPKIEGVKRMVEARGLKVDIEVDGGINERTAPLAVKAGANVLVAGFAIYGKKDVGLSIRKLRDSVRRMKIRGPIFSAL